MLLLKLADPMFRPCQITCRFPSIISFKRKVTPPDEELRTILCHALIFHFTDEKFGLFTFWFLKGVPAGAHPGSSWPFSLLHPLPHSLSNAYWTSHHLSNFDQGKKLFSRKKIETLRGKRSPTSAWHMGFVRERGLTLWVRGARSVSNPYFFCTVYICQGTTLINYQLQTLGYQ